MKFKVTKTADWELDESEGRVEGLLMGHPVTSYAISPSPELRDARPGDVLDVGLWMDRTGEMTTSTPDAAPALEQVDVTSGN